VYENGWNIAVAVGTLLLALATGVMALLAWRNTRQTRDMMRLRHRPMFSLGGLTRRESLWDGNFDLHVRNTGRGEAALVELRLWVGNGCAIRALGGRAVPIGETVSLGSLKPLHDKAVMEDLTARNRRLLDIRHGVQPTKEAAVNEREEEYLLLVYLDTLGNRYDQRFVLGPSAGVFEARQPILLARGFRHVARKGAAFVRRYVHCAVLAALGYNVSKEDFFRKGG
jgi:hypothetical protein